MEHSRKLKNLELGVVTIAGPDKSAAREPFIAIRVLVGDVQLYAIPMSI